MNSKLILISLLLVVCGMDDDSEFYADIKEPTCWTNKGDPNIYEFIPEGFESTPEFREMCLNLGR